MSSVAAPSTASRLAPALADGIAVSMREDPRVYVWGEDVRIGVMGPTRGLADEFLFVGDFEVDHEVGILQDGRCRVREAVMELPPGP